MTDTECQSSILGWIVALVGGCKSFSSYNLPIDPVTHYPQLQACLSQQFALYYPTPDLSSAFENLYTNPTLIDKIVNYWRVMAEQLGTNPYVMGYDLFNEPWYPLQFCSCSFSFYAMSLSFIYFVCTGVSACVYLCVCICVGPATSGVIHSSSSPVMLIRLIFSLSINSYTLLFVHPTIRRYFFMKRCNFPTLFLSSVVSSLMSVSPHHQVVLTTMIDKHCLIMCTAV